MYLILLLFIFRAVLNEKFKVRLFLLLNIFIFAILFLWVLFCFLDDEKINAVIVIVVSYCTI